MDCPVLLRAGLAEPKHGIGNLLRAHKATLRIRAKQGFARLLFGARGLAGDLFKRCVQQFGFRVAGADGVDGDAFHRDFQCE